MTPDITNRLHWDVRVRVKEVLDASEFLADGCGENRNRPEGRDWPIDNEGGPSQEGTAALRRREVADGIDQR